jgi:4-nitrophenyl phosphatase
MNDLTTIKNLILDMDGVLWHGETAVPGLAHFFETLRQREIGYILATNNATKTVDQYIAKLARFGVQVEGERILTSSLATAAYLSERYPPETAVYAIGERGLREALKERGLRILGRWDGQNGERAAAVVMGLDRTAQYDDLAAAVWYITQQEAQFVATNPDATLPTERGPMPGAGALVAAVQAATNVTPLVIGKPGPYLFNEALRRLGSPLEETAMVGDRLTTDIAGAQAVGLPAILLLSGVTDQIGAAVSGIKPEWTFADLAALTAAIQSPAT